MRLFRDQQQRSDPLEVSRFFGMLNHFPEYVSGVGLGSGMRRASTFLKPWFSSSASQNEQGTEVSSTALIRVPLCSAKSVMCLLVFKVLLPCKIKGI
jgi:hypothetical protein